MDLEEWFRVRRGWSMRCPQTALDALADMDINSASHAAAGAAEGAGRVCVCAQMFVSVCSSLTYRVPFQLSQRRGPQVAGGGWTPPQNPCWMLWVRLN